MALTNEQRMKYIQNTLRNSIYIGMNLVEHKIDTLVRTHEGIVIRTGELILRHIPSNRLIKLVWERTKQDRNDQTQNGCISHVSIQEVGEWIEVGAYSIRKLIERWGR